MENVTYINLACVDFFVQQCSLGRCRACLHPSALSFYLRLTLLSHPTRNPPVSKRSVIGRLLLLLLELHVSSFQSPSPVETLDVEGDFKRGWKYVCSPLITLSIFIRSFNNQSECTITVYKNPHDFQTDSPSSRFFLVEKLIE